MGEVRGLNLAGTGHYGEDAREQVLPLLARLESELQAIQLYGSLVKVG